MQHDWNVRIRIETGNGMEEQFSVEKEITQPGETAFLKALSQTAEMFLKYMRSESYPLVEQTKSAVEVDTSYMCNHTYWETFNKY